MHLPNDESCPVDNLVPYKNNARTHSKKQLRQIADSIVRFGFTNPVLVSDDNMIIAGHGRVEPAKLLGMTEVPIRRLSHLNKDEVRAYVLADNRIAENTGWDRDLLAIELLALDELDFDLEILGFSTAEIDLTLGGVVQAGAEPDPVLDKVEAVSSGPAITQAGDLWLLGPHRLLCGDARSSADVERVCGADTIALLFTDPPYNVPIDGHVSGLGKTKHREFELASGEMDEEAFAQFLTESLQAAAAPLKDSAIAFVFMEWRHMRELLSAGYAAFDELKNLCVWNKTNGGMGTFYRSKHELVFVFKKGKAPHTNNFGLGDTGRYRTNVWDYPGINTFGETRDADIAMHPTVKPVALIADAIKDCTKRGEIVLDTFGGSGSTLIAADQCGRNARLIEYDPLYCDTVIRRFERITGETTRLERTGETFAQTRQSRAPDRSEFSHETQLCL